MDHIPYVWYVWNVWYGWYVLYAWYGLYASRALKYNLRRSGWIGIPTRLPMSYVILDVRYEREHMRYEIREALSYSNTPIRVGRRIYAYI